MARFAVGLSLFCPGTVRLFSRCQTRTTLAPIVRRIILALAIGLCLITCALAQTDPDAGILPFSTQVGGTIDSLDLATGSITLQVPIRSKAGKMPFSYSLVGGSHAFIYTFSEQGVYKELWSTGTGLLLGVPFAASLGATVPISFASNQTCGQRQGVSVWSISSVVDPTGAAHPLLTTEKWDTALCYPPETKSFMTTDGSGYTVYGTVSNGAFSMILYDRSGNTVSGGTVTDPDGVTMSGPPEGSSGTYTDTLGTTAITSTITKGANGGTDTYVYKDAGGTQRTVTVNYTKYTQRTVFGCTDPLITDIDSPVVYLPTTILLPTGASYKLSYETTPNYGPDVTGRIASITLPSGGTVTYQYSGGNNNSGMDCNSGVVPTLKRTVNDNNGNSGTWTYVNSNDSAELGNFTVTETDPAGNQTIHSFSGEYQTQAAYYQGSATGAPLRTVLTCYNGNTSNCATPSSVPTLPITETDVYTSFNGGSSNHVQTLFDSYSNVTSVLYYDFGGTTLLSKTAYLYGQSLNGSACNPYPSGTYIFNTPCNYYTWAPSGQTAAVHISYSNSGHPTSVLRWVSGSNPGNWLTSTTGYNSNGTLAWSKDAAGNQTTYGYAPTGSGGCNGLLLTSTTYALSSVGSDSQTWDCNGGGVTATKDVNGNTTYYCYNNSGACSSAPTADALYRLVQIIYPDSSSDTATFSYSTGSSLPWTIKETKAESASASFSIEKVLDGLGRTVTGETLGDPSGTDYVSTTYNNLGQVVSVSQPYRSGGTVYNNSYSYDALGRVTYIQTANALNKYITYSGRATEVQLYPYWDDKQTIYQSDGLGRITNVCEVTTAIQQGSYGTPASCNLDIGGTGFLTQYTYDASGNLISIGQEMNVAPLGARDFTYDGLSRLTSEATPEQSLGTTYTYDTLQAGDLYQRIAPLENSYSGYVTTTYQFDTMHRLQTAKYNDNLTSSLWFYYDSTGPLWQGGPSVSNPKGRMIEAGSTAPSGKSTLHAFGYDAMGRTSYHLYQPPSLYGTGNYYPAGYNYDFLGNPLNGQNWLAGWNNYYNALGQLQTIWTSWLSPSQNGDLMWNRTYNAAGQPASDSLANGINETWGYDGANNPNNYGTGGVGYTYSVEQWLGNDFVASAYDNIIGQWTYTYDNLGRLATATCSSGNCPYGSTNTPAFSYQYDPVGNRWKQNVTAGTGPSVQVSFSYQHNWLVGNSYDVAGNVTNDGNHSYTYDAEGRILQVDSGGTESNIYDAFGRISSQTVGTSTSEWIYDLSGHVVAQTLAGSTTPSRADFWEGGRHWAYSPDVTNLYFIHSDWLGTAKATSNLSLTQGGGCFSLPFGDDVSCTSPSEEYFTDQMVDTSDNLGIFAAREYAPQYAIWMHPDPAGLAAVDITNPQSWNRYAYVANNPLGFVDPFGLDYEEVAPPPDFISDFLVYPDPDYSIVTDLVNSAVDAVTLAPQDSTPFDTPDNIELISQSSASTGFSVGGGIAIGAGAGLHFQTQNDASVYGVYGWGQQILSHPTLQTATWTMTDPRTYALFAGASVLAGTTGYAAYDISRVENGLVFGTRIGGNTPLLNSPTALRIGWSWSRQYGVYVFRIGGTLLSTFLSNPHINLWPPSWWGGPPAP